MRRRGPRPISGKKYTEEMARIGREETMSKPQFGEPWAIDSSATYSVIEDRNGQGVVDDGSARGEYCPLNGASDPKMKRIVACVNACAGLTDEQLNRVRAVNELYGALKEILPSLNPEGEEVQIVLAAIALAEGKEGE